MQSKKQKKKNTVFAIGGGIVLAAFFLIAIIWVVEGAKTGTGQAAYILEKIGVESLETLHRFLVQTLVVAAAMLLAFFILVHKYRKKARILLGQEKADKERLKAALAQIERERTAMEIFRRH